MAIDNKAQLIVKLNEIEIAVNGDGPDKTLQEFITDGVGVLATVTVRRMWDKLTLQSQSQIDSYQIQRRERIDLAAPAEVISAAGIDQNIIYVSAPAGGQTIQLPELTAALFDIEFSVITLTQNLITLVPFGGDLVFGSNPVNRDGVWNVRATPTGWFAVFFPFAERNRIHTYENGNALVTTISAVDTWTPINCALGLSVGETNFTMAGNTITYTGLLTMYAEYHLSVSIQRTGVTPQFRMTGIAPMVNGADPTNAIATTDVDAENDKNVVAVGILQLSPGDTIQPGVVNMSNDDDYEVMNVSLLLKGW